jgi:hypothetical protein
MQDIYGHKWSSAHGDSDVNGTWASALGDLTPEQIGNGLHACVIGGYEWPPTLVKFRKLCVAGPDKRENEAMYRMPPSHQLTHQITPETRQYGRSMCAYLKQKVRAS